MLRFAIISLSTLGVLGAVFFFVVLRAQPVHLSTSTTQATVAPTGLSPVQPQSGVGPGKQPWIKNFEDGRLVSEFTASDFTPQKDGSFLAQHPEAIYYMNKGEFLLVKGESGTMYCDSSGAAPANNSLFSGPTGTPRNGSLRHVRIELYPTLSATKPTQWMETDNIRFDNDTYRMYTESYVDPQGNTVPADQVPVSIRGDQYEFDGNGLTMRWNAINHRLERLEVAHGKRLEIKDPTKLALPGMAAPETTKHVEAPTNQNGQNIFTSRVPLGRGALGVSNGAARSNDPQPKGVRLSKNEATVQLIADKRTATAKVDAPTPYRAVFHDTVEIEEPDQTLAIADLMMVDFLQGSSKTKTPAAAAPAPMETPTTEPVAATLPAQTPATTTAATKPTNGPITITWTGPLLVTPLQGQAIMPLSPVQSIVKLVGTPVKLTPQGSEVQAATAIYRNPDGAVQLHNSAEFPVIHLTQTKGLHLDTAGLDYDPATAMAVLTGPNELNVPVAQKQMKVTWTQQGLLHIIRVPSQPNGVDRIDLSGDVAVKHPMFTLDSNHLLLDLDLLPKPGAKPTEGDEQLKLLTATGDVQCRLMHPDKSTQEIDSDKLVIRTERTAAKQTVPREVIADGNAIAFDPDQSIRAGHLDALLSVKPTTKPVTADTSAAVDLDTLNADTKVHAILKSGATADSEKLKVTTVDGKQYVQLSGDGGALLNNRKGSWLQGPVVDIDADQGGVKVTGPGTMETVRNKSTTQPGKPIDVTWSDSMSFQGSKNIADVHGNVNVHNVDAAGTVSNMTGDNAHIDLMDAPKDPKKTPSTQQDGLGSAMGDKQLKLLTLTGHVNGDSELHGPDGLLQRQSVLHGDKLVYNAVDGTVTIPGPGRMLMENHRADPKQGANNRGNLAVAWNRQLLYNQTTQKIFIDGNTVVGFEKEAAKPQAAPMQLRAQHLIITLAKAPATKDGDGKLQLSQMQANGQVAFNAQGADFRCDNVNYDPKTGLMKATGHGVTVNADQTISGTFDELIYDTVKEEVLHVTNSQVKVQK